MHDYVGPLDPITLKQMPPWKSGVSKSKQEKSVSQDCG